MTSMEDDPNGRQPQWRTTAMEEDLMVVCLSGRRPQWTTTSREHNLKGITPLKNDLMEVDLNGRITGIR